MKKSDIKKTITAVSIMMGTCIGAGVLGIPYVAAQVGFFVALIYIILLASIFLVVNLYLGEISLRTKGDHQLAGYAQKYLGKKASYLMEFATIFSVYSAIIAYMLGVGESLSFLFFSNPSYTLIFGALFGLAMSYLLWRGIRALKRFEKIGVSIILFLLLVVFFVFGGQVQFSNLFYFNLGAIFLPFGVVLFALKSFEAIPELQVVLHKHEHLMKRSLIISMILAVLFYSFFAFVVVGFKGLQTPEVATLTLGNFFVLIGIFTMFTSYLSMGNALQENFCFDERMKKKEAWFLVSIFPIFLFLLLQFSELFSFTSIMSLGGVLSGGLIAILVLFMIKNAKKHGDRAPEYSMPVSWILILFLVLLFILGVIKEVLFLI